MVPDGSTVARQMTIACKRSHSARGRDEQGASNARGPSERMSWMGVFQKEPFGKHHKDSPKPNLFGSVLGVGAE